MKVEFVDGLMGFLGARLNKRNSNPSALDSWFWLVVFIGAAALISNFYPSLGRNFFIGFGLFLCARGVINLISQAPIPDCSIVTYVFGFVPHIILFCLVFHSSVRPEAFFALYTTSDSKQISSIETNLAGYRTIYFGPTSYRVSPFEIAISKNWITKDTEVHVNDYYFDRSKTDLARSELCTATECYEAILLD